MVLFCFFRRSNSPVDCTNSIWYLEPKRTQILSNSSNVSVCPWADDLNNYIMSASFDQQKNLTLANVLDKITELKYGKSMSKDDTSGSTGGSSSATSSNQHHQQQQQHTGSGGGNNNTKQSPSSDNGDFDENYLLEELGMVPKQELTKVWKRYLLTL